MRATVINGSELDHELVAKWRSIQVEAGLDSPHFAPDLVQATAAVREGVEVAVLEDDGNVVGFFPYHREKDVATPFAGEFSDLQALIVAAEADWSIRDILRDCRLKAWRFERLITSQQPMSPFHATVAESSFMDLSEGFAAYRENRQQAKSDELREALRKGRKIERDHGTLKFIPHSLDSQALDQLLAWKREQLKRMQVVDFQDVAWTVPLLQRVQQMESAEFSGMCNVVTVADRPVAISMGMRSATVVQGWVTAFDRDFYKYSPGLILFTQLAQHAESLGIQRIDMGSGPEPFKQSFRSGMFGVAAGSVETSYLSESARRVLLACKERIRHTVVGESLQRLVRRMRFWMGSKSPIQNT